MRRLPWAGPARARPSSGGRAPRGSGARRSSRAGAAGRGRHRRPRPGRRRAGAGLVHGGRAADASARRRRSSAGPRPRSPAGSPTRTSRRPRSTFPGSAGRRATPIARRRDRREPRARSTATSRRSGPRSRAGVPIVMISNASYPALDAKPAPWSPRIQSLLRDELGFKGVTISDALDGAAATRGRALPSVAVLVAQAGVDLLLFTGSEASSAAAYRAARRRSRARGSISPACAAAELRPDPRRSRRAYG